VSHASVIALLAIGVFAPAAPAAPYQITPVAPRSYAETYTTIATLDDGTYIQAQLVVSNLSLGRERGACRVLLVRPGQVPWTVAETVEREAWATATWPTPSLRVGPCRAATTRQGTTVDLQLGGTSVLISLARRAEGVVPPGHPVHVDDAFYESEILVPFAPAEVVLARGSDPSESLRGFGYADHSRSTTLPGDLARGWLRFRGFGAGCSTLFLARLPPGAGALQGYIWRDGAPAPRALSGLVANLPPEDAAPGAVVVQVQGKDTAFTLRGRRLLYRDAPLEGYGFAGRLLGAYIGRAVTQTYEAVLEQAGPCGRVPGILEVDHIGS
jgi:hypothetical protein